MRDIDITVDFAVIAESIKEHPVLSLFLTSEVLFTVCGIIEYHRVTDVLILLGMLCAAAGVTILVSRIAD